jgi:hypothetical protein
VSRLPGRARLARTLVGLARHLPAQLHGLVDAPRFDAERPALESFADPDRAAAAAAAMAEEEAGWLADVLEERWAAVAEVVLEPAAAILAPAEVWLGRQGVAVPLEVVVEGLDEGWAAAWEGDIAGSAAGGSVLLEARPPSVEGPAQAVARVKVDGRAGGRRTLLVDHVLIPLRVPRVAVSADRRQLLVRDQAERPAAGVAVSVGDAAFRTDARGLVYLDERLAETAELRVEGMRVEAAP